MEILRNQLEGQKILKISSLVVGLLLLGGGGFVYSQVSAFDASMAKVYEVPVPNMTHSSDPLVIARGKDPNRDLEWLVALVGKPDGTRRRLMNEVDPDVVIARFARHLEQDIDVLTRARRHVLR